jgi:hypothetical protein
VAFGLRQSTKEGFDARAAHGPFHHERAVRGVAAVVVYRIDGRTWSIQYSHPSSIIRCRPLVTPIEFPGHTGPLSSRFSPLYSTTYFPPDWNQSASTVPGGTGSSKLAELELLSGPDLVGLIEPGRDGGDRERRELGSRRHRPTRRGRAGSTATRP